MKGNVAMKRLNSSQQIIALTKLIEAEISQQNAMPIQAAKKDARNKLVEAGIVDDNGQLKEPYVAESRYV